MIPLCMDQGIGLLPWSPLARGFLTGTRTRENPRPTTRAGSDEYADKLYYQEADFQVLDALLEVSRARGAKPAQVAIAWLLSLPAVTAPILGATKPEHVTDALDALRIRLTPEEIQTLEKPYQPHPVLGHDQPGPRDAGRARRR